jgi:hypothetical protein
MGIVDRNYLFLLKQHIEDLENIEFPVDPLAKLSGTFHALTTEYNVLRNCIQFGSGYIQDYPVANLDPGFNRFNMPPDQNLVIFVSGFKSSWDDAVREAYATAYKLGYPLEDIYVFNYGSETPLHLAEIIGKNGRYVGDFKLRYELLKMIKMEIGLKSSTSRQSGSPFAPKLDDLNNKLSNFLFTEDNNLGGTLDSYAARLARNILYIKNERIEDIENGRKINLIGSSQGSAVVAGFLLGNYDSYNPGSEKDREINVLLGKYALLISAHGGAYLAQAYSFVLKKTNLLFSLVTMLVDFTRKYATSLVTRQLAIDSPFTQANYERAASATRLNNLEGIEVYAANDDVTTSLPMARLPSTKFIRMISGRHGEIITGLDEQAGNKANKYIYHFLNKGIIYKNFESDLLIYSGYLKRGLPDADFTTALFTIFPAGLRFIIRLFLNNVIGTRLIPTFFGGAGVVSVDVQRTVMNELGRKLLIEEPTYWPRLKFEDFYD